MDVTEQFRPRVDVSMICHESSLAQTTGAQLAKAFDHQKQQGSRLLARLQKTDPLFEIVMFSIATPQYQNNVSQVIAGMQDISRLMTYLHTNQQQVMNLQSFAAHQEYYHLQGQAHVEAENAENVDRVEYFTAELRKAEAQHDEDQWQRSVLETTNDALEKELATSEHTVLQLQEALQARQSPPYCPSTQGQADVEAEMRENEDRVEYLTEELRKAEAQHDEDQWHRNVLEVTADALREELAASENTVVQLQKALQARQSCSHCQLIQDLAASSSTPPSKTPLSPSRPSSGSLYTPSSRFMPQAVTPLRTPKIDVDMSLSAFQPSQKTAVKDTLVRGIDYPFSPLSLSQSPYLPVTQLKKAVTPLSDMNMSLSAIQFSRKTSGKDTLIQGDDYPYSPLSDSQSPYLPTLELKTATCGTAQKPSLAKVALSPPHTSPLQPLAYKLGLASCSPMAHLTGNKGGKSSPVAGSITPAHIRQRALQPLTNRMSLASRTPLAKVAGAVDIENTPPPTTVTLTSSQIMKPSENGIEVTACTPGREASADDGTKHSSPGTPSTVAAPPASTARRAAAFSSTPSAASDSPSAMSYTSGVSSVTPPLRSASPLKRFMPSASPAVSGQVTRAKKAAFPGITRLRLRLPSTPKALTGKNSFETSPAAEEKALQLTGDSISAGDELVTRQTGFAGIRRLKIKPPTKPDSSSNSASCDITTTDCYLTPAKASVADAAAGSPGTLSCSSKYIAETPHSFPLKGLVVNCQSEYSAHGSPLSKLAHSSASPLANNDAAAIQPIAGLYQNANATARPQKLQSSLKLQIAQAWHRHHTAVASPAQERSSHSADSSDSIQGDNCQSPASPHDFPLTGLVVNCGDATPMSPGRDALQSPVGRPVNAAATQPELHSSRRLSLAAAWRRHQASAAAAASFCNSSNSTHFLNDDKSQQAAERTSLGGLVNTAHESTYSLSICKETSSLDASPVTDSASMAPTVLHSALKQQLAAAFTRYRKAQDAAAIVKPSAQAAHSKLDGSSTHQTCLAHAASTVRRSTRLANVRAASTAATAAQVVPSGPTAISAKTGSSAKLIDTSGRWAAGRSTIVAGAARRAAAAKTASDLKPLTTRSTAALQAASTLKPTSGKTLDTCKPAARTKASAVMKPANAIRTVLAPLSVISEKTVDNIKPGHGAAVVKPSPTGRVADTTSKITGARVCTRRMTRNTASRQSKAVAQPRWL